MGEVGAPALLGVVVAAGGHQSNECQVLQEASCLVWPGGRRACYPVADEQGPGVHRRKHTTTGATDIRPQHSHISIPCQLSKGKSHWQ